MTSTKPYLLRAIYEWSLDNGLTPQILVDATADNVEVPTQHVQDGQILLNVHPDAVDALKIDNEFIMFGARFGGVHFDIMVPMVATLAVFSRENGQGIFFQSEDGETTSQPGDVGEASDGVAPNTAPSGPRAVTTDDDAGDAPRPGPDDDTPGGNRPNLRLVD